MDDVKLSRLQAIEEKTTEPFARARDLVDCSLYWMPVSGYPVNAMQRQWLLEFCERLAVRLKQTQGLREEVFLHFKSLYPDLVDRFTERAMDFVPMSGAAVTPGMALPKTIDMDDLKQKVKEAGEKGTMLDVQPWMPDHLYWFVKKKAAEQRQSFFGLGGMLSLFLKPDPGTKAPVIEIPRFVRTSPGFAGGPGESMNADIQMAHSLRDSFLAKSKALFGERLRETPSYKGLLFVLPFFTAGTILQTTREEREQWFDVFAGYLVETPSDKGVLLLLKEPDFDEELADIVRGMREDGHVYRS